MRNIGEATVIYVFEDCKLSPHSRELTRDSQPIATEPQVFELILFLIENRDRVVTKDEIIERVWGGRCISDSTVSSRVTAARRALLDSGSKQHIIRTYPRVGFRFVAEVREMLPFSSASDDDVAVARPPEVEERGENPATTAALRHPIAVLHVWCEALSEAAADRDVEANTALYTTLSQAIAAAAFESEGSRALSWMGDYQLHFGYPHAIEDASLRAVRAALSVRDSLRKEDRADAVCMAIAKGDCAALGLAAPNAPTPLLVGSALHEAQSLARRGVPGHVAVPEDVRAELERGFLFERSATDTQGVWTVLNELPAETRFAARAGRLQSPFCGRNDELALLRRRWETLRGRGRVVLISAPSGYGKSRLCEEFLGRTGSEESLALRLQCDPAKRSSALHPVADWLALQTRNPSGPAAQLLRDFADAAPIGRRALLAAHRAFSVGGRQRRPSDAMSATELRELSFRTVSAFVDWVASERPLAVLVEDLHWIDSTSLQLLSRLVSENADKSVLLLFTARPEFSPPWPALPHVDFINLSAMSEDECRDILKYFFDGAAPKATKEILTKASGVPLFVELLARNYGGDIEVDNGTLTTEYATTRTPATVRSSVLIALERADTGAQLAPICACLGGEFTYADVVAVSTLDAAETDEALRRLVENGVLFAFGTPPAARYAFAHAMIRDAIYDSIIATDVESLHARVYQRLCDDPECDPSRLAHHALAASEWGAAIKHLSAAANNAANRAGYKETASHLEAALDVAKTKLLPTPETVDLRLKLFGWLIFALISAEGYLSERAQAVAGEALLLADASPASKFAYPPKYGKWTLMLATGPQERAHAFISDTLRDVNKNAIDSQVFFANSLAGYSSLTLGRLNEAEIRFDRAMERLDLERHQRQTQRFGHIPGSDLYFRRSFLRALQGSAAASRADADAALRLCGRRTDIHARTQLLMKLAMVSSLLGDFDRVERYQVALQRLSRDYQLGLAAIVARIYGAVLDTRNGLPTAFETFQDAMMEYEDRIMIFECATRYAVEAGLLFESGQLDFAEVAFRRAADLVETTQEQLVYPEVLRIEAAISAARSGVDDAAEILVRATAAALEQGATLWVLKAAITRVELHTGRPGAAPARAQLAHLVERHSSAERFAALDRARALLRLDSSSRERISRATA